LVSIKELYYDARPNKSQDSLSLLFGIVSGYAWCCQTPRVWALNQVSAGELNQGMLKLVYKARNMVK